MIKPHRKDDFVPRQAVKVRVEESTLEALDLLAAELKASRAHVCDLVLAVAFGEERDAFRQAVSDRMAAAFKKLDERWQR